MKEIKWSLKKCYVQEISLRKRKNHYTKNEEEYAVVRISFDDPFDTFKLVRGTKKTSKDVTLMCFRREIYLRVVPEDRFSFKGFISFGYGNTFLVIEGAYDSLGFDIESKESIHFKEIKEIKEISK